MSRGRRCRRARGSPRSCRRPRDGRAQGSCYAQDMHHAHSAGGCAPPSPLGGLRLGHNMATVNALLQRLQPAQG